MNTCKFPNVDKSLGPEMKSTGEPVCRGRAIYFIKDMKNPSTPSGALCRACLLYTSDAADERSSVDLGGRRIIKKKNMTD